ncbi:MAG: hypothetical protein HXN26_10295 [Prevotella aurantiaca]|jgi:hypothetical protein|uniref:Uncharacterized protein n=1 Tax=Prevotella aurantiaca TaxID=596085 RepID=A0A930N0J8_9BACT|nr:hypothetical protein [Prevotella aurantiaca]
MKLREIHRVVSNQTIKNTYLVKYFVSFFVLFNLLFVSSVTAKDTSSCHTTLQFLHKDSCKTDFKVLEFIEYAWNKKAYPKETRTAIPQIVHIHRLYIIPYFESLTQRDRKSLNIKITNIRYNCQHTFLNASYKNDNDSICNAHFVIDKLEFPSDQQNLLNYLKRKIDNEPIKVDVASESPTLCFTFWRKNALIIVYYNIFDDKEMILKTIDAYLGKKSE